MRRYETGLRSESFCRLIGGFCSFSQGLLTGGERLVEDGFHGQKEGNTRTGDVSEFCVESIKQISEAASGREGEGGKEKESWIYWGL